MAEGLPIPDQPPLTPQNLLTPSQGNHRYTFCPRPCQSAVWCYNKHQRWSTKEGKKCRFGSQVLGGPSNDWLITPCFEPGWYFTVGMCVRAKEKGETDHGPSISFENSFPKLFTRPHFLKVPQPLQHSSLEDTHEPDAGFCFMFVPEFPWLSTSWEWQNQCLLFLPLWGRHI